MTDNNLTPRGRGALPLHPTRCPVSNSSAQSWGEVSFGFTSTSTTVLPHHHYLCGGLVFAIVFQVWEGRVQTQTGADKGKVERRRRVAYQVEGGSGWRSDKKVNSYPMTSEDDQSGRL